MIIDILLMILRFLLLLAVQVLLLNNIQLNGYLNPQLYVLFLLTLPVHLPRLILLIIAFICGLMADLFTNTMGMHAAACVFMAYLRPGWLRFIAPRDGYESDAVPSIRKFGLNWFLIYTGFLVLCHHFVLFFIEVFRFSEFFTTLWRILLSSFLTLFLVIMSQFLFSKQELRTT